jgi:hypothetical protein
MKEFPLRSADPFPSASPKVYYRKKREQVSAVSSLQVQSRESLSASTTESPYSFPYHFIYRVSRLFRTN